MKIDNRVFQCNKGVWSTFLVKERGDENIIEFSLEREPVVTYERDGIIKRVLLLESGGEVVLEVSVKK
jgi:hypothetical protein